MGGTIAVKGVVISAIVAVALLAGAFVLSSSFASAQTPSPTPDTQQSAPTTPTTPSTTPDTQTPGTQNDQQGTHNPANCPNMGNNDGSSSYQGGASSSGASFQGGHRGMSLVYRQ